MDMLKALRYGSYPNSINVYEGILNHELYTYVGLGDIFLCGPLLCNVALYLLAQGGGNRMIHASCWLRIPKIQERLLTWGKFHDFHNHGDINLSSLKLITGRATLPRLHGPHITP